MFTFNNYTDETEQFFKELNCRYIIYGREEAPSTGTKHLQGYVYFSNPRSFKSVREEFGCHIEKARSGAEKNKEYCIKSNDFYERGEIPNQGCRTDVSTVINMIHEGHTDYSIANEMDSFYFRYHKGIEKYRNLYLEDTTKEFRKLEVIILHGKPGTGKTRYVMDKEDDVYKLDFDETLWWDGYRQQRVLLLDDFYGNIRYSKLLNILDGYQLRLPIKGGHTYANWIRVYITSNEEPNTWYSKNIDALMRRVTRVEHIVEQK